MSTTTENQVHGKFNEVAGKVKQAVGEATGNDSLANKGAAQQVQGHAEQAWGTIKGAAQDAAAHAKASVDEYKARHAVENEQHAHDARTAVTSAAEHTKDGIHDAVKGKS